MTTTYPPAMATRLPQFEEVDTAPPLHAREGNSPEKEPSMNTQTALLEMPAVREFLRAQAEQDTAQKIDARATLIDQIAITESALPDIEARMAEEATKVKQALEALQAVRQQQQGVEAERTQMLATYQRQLRDLRKQHGEQIVIDAKVKLGARHGWLVLEMARLKSLARKTEMIGGVIPRTVVNPKAQADLNETTRRAAEVKEALGRITLLERAKVSPDDLRYQVETILATVEEF
jgi:hypothetical protein